MKKLIIQQLIKKARPILQSYGLLKTIKIKPALVWEPSDEKVLVLAPHMDDEVIGCGGTLYKHIRKGAEVAVVFITDGRFGDKSLKQLKARERLQRETDLAMDRKHEAQLALETLGIKQAFFLDARDMDASSINASQDKLRVILDSFRPAIVYLPFFLEEHPDHAAASSLLLGATRDRKHDFECFGYEVWTPLLPNCYVVIDDAVDVKKKALQHYQTQLADMNYIHTAIGLNAYRSSALLDSKDSYVEAFFRAPLGEYRELHGLILQH